MTLTALAGSDLLKVAVKIGLFDWLTQLSVHEPQNNRRFVKGS
uniref:Uncharacterized protein n=1 Tax=Anguilla anguilla TaxID=7936 RepID=A0A0E9WM46_ANGAN